MLKYRKFFNPALNENCIITNLTGKELLTCPLLNKGTAFSMEEREELGVLGKLPSKVETLEQQVIRAYQQYSGYQSSLQKNIYLNNLHDKNETLFYRLVRDHVTEMIPMIYTPVVGSAVQAYSREFRQPRGLYISHKDKGNIRNILQNRTNPEIKLLVVTDGEGVLGIGDQGVGAIDIPIAKIMVYTLWGGIDPAYTLPIMLDVGTNNQELLSDPMYLGLHEPRLGGKEYDEFIEEFVTVAMEIFPTAFLHFEDFGRNNARKILNKYRNRYCCFNDDIQGTGAVAVAALMSAVTITQTKLSEQKIVVFGAGTAGMGIADQIVKAMVSLGLSEKQAYDRFWVIDKEGLLTTNSDAVLDFQQPYMRDAKEQQSWDMEDKNNLDLLTVIKNVQPTVLIGCSAVRGAFTEEVINTMYANAKRPIIFPLSNPNEKCEAYPADIMRWTEGNALIATGSPFAPVAAQGKHYTIAQCNNALIFPGIGLGVLAVKAKRLTDDMLVAAIRVLSESSVATEDPLAPLLPRLEQAEEVARKIAIGVAEAAVAAGVAGISMDLQQIEAKVKDMFWEPKYCRIKAWE